MVAVLDTPLLSFKSVTISMFVREHHIKVYNSEGDVWNGDLSETGLDFDAMTRDTLISVVKEVVKVEMIRRLNA